MSEKKTPQPGAGQTRSIQDRPLGQSRRPAAADNERPVVRRAPQPPARPLQQPAGPRTGVPTATQRAAQQQTAQPVRPETERIPVRRTPPRQMPAAPEAAERPQTRRPAPQTAQPQNAQPQSAKPQAAPQPPRPVPQTTQRQPVQEMRYQPRQQRPGQQQPRQERIDPTQHERANWKEKQIVRKRRQRTMRIIMAVAAVVIVLSIFAVILAVDLGGGAQTFYEGVSVDGLKLNGYTMEEAEAKLIALNGDRVASMAVHLSYEGREWTISPEQMGVALDIEEKLEQAWAYGREGNIFKRQKEIRSLRKNNENLTTVFSYDIDKVRERLNEVKQSIDLPATDATVNFDPSKEERFTIVQEHNGRSVDLDALLMQVKTQLDNSHTSSIEIKPNVVSPTMFAADLEQATERVSRVKTDLGSSSEARIHNIKTALSYFNGMVLQPGQEVSFNKTTGPRGLEQGYQNAGVIQDDEIIDGPGGGVCQASTTLYQAVVKAGLEIVRSNKHSLPVSYVDVGTDAAVAYDYKDLIFRNNTDYPIFIEGRVSGSSVVVAIYGYPLEEGTEIKIVTDVYEKIQPAEPKITLDTDAQYVTYTDETHIKKKPREGVKVKSYRVTYKDGEEVSRELLRDDYYKEVQGETYQGVTPREGGAVPPEENDE